MMNFRQLKNHSNSLALELTELKKRLRDAEEIITVFESIREDSTGIAGYHLNDDIASWGEFEVDWYLRNYYENHKPEDLI